MALKLHNRTNERHHRYCGFDHNLRSRRVGHHGWACALTIHVDTQSGTPPAAWVDNLCASPLSTSVHATEASFLRESASAWPPPWPGASIRMSQACPSRTWFLISARASQCKRPDHPLRGFHIRHSGAHGLCGLHQQFHIRCILRCRRWIALAV